MVLRLTLNRDVHHILIRQIRIKSLNVDFGEHGLSMPFLEVDRLP